MKISMDKIIRAMSIALDLAQMSSRGSNYNTPIIEKITNINYSNHRFMHHSQRTTYIALKIAEQLNLSEDRKKYIYVVSLLHDIGASNCLDESHSSSLFIKKHCITGANIISTFPKFKGIDRIILYHHENFDGSGAIGLKGDSIPIESQIIRVSDITELLYKEDENVFKQREYIRNWIKRKSGIIFSKEIADAFLDISSKDIFWFDMENISFMDIILDKVRPKLNIYFDLNEFAIIAGIFANIIDDKSKFTATHSKGIAELAYLVSIHIGYDREKCSKMRIAGLLHDIGKLAIPISILDKEGALTPEEFEIIKSHVYYTRIILDRIEDIPDISTWASNHHEKLNGKGYPEGLTAKDLSEESRILAVCDIYQALTEDRPYRIGMERGKAFSIMDDMVKGGFICGRAFGNLKCALNSINEIKDVAR
ncbi:MAG: HD domain-containing protein [Clostridium sp.]|jgi:putative nucleotidyltransferase with HDIG domain|uniref:HD-GYP domain-containing protein n=1 Tax=Clostridium sp. TaxID=1506 RepID=UPI0025BC43B4|nr:HD domain-containing phosphohydrolase [Clostridium sp.]MCH3965998.1 HD domain-containing protein [Clostridium sp.]MCI1715914.1 HD domain-containing protein [Clostridium sp.]MCI1800414.1 HD domain-containing protein [Clostridium sp.]MCI1814091.1 HD domain-containing protein [Clostridium sp.]MCI1870989.1 HD domain-containing protein [Clostridium sp.]